MRLFGLAIVVATLLRGSTLSSFTSIFLSTYCSGWTREGGLLVDWLRPNLLTKLLMNGLFIAALAPYEGCAFLGPRSENAPS